VKNKDLKAGLASVGSSDRTTTGKTGEQIAVPVTVALGTADGKKYVYIGQANAGATLSVLPGIPPPLIIAHHAMYAMSCLLIPRRLLAPPRSASNTPARATNPEPARYHGTGVAAEHNPMARITATVLYLYLTCPSFSAGLLAAEGEGAVWKDDLPRIISDVRSETFAIRAKATAALARFVDRHGPAAEDALQAYRDDKDADARRAVAIELARIADMKKDAEIFAWYDALGFPDPKGKPFGRIASSWWKQEDKTQIIYTYGFLVEDRLDCVRLISQWREVTVSKKGDEENRHPAFERVDLAASIRDLCADLNEEAVSRWEPFRGMHTTGSRRMELLMMARLARQLGLFRESRRLMALAAEATSNRGQAADGGAFVAGVKEDFAHAMTWEAVLACDQPEPTRESLLHRFQLILRNFPGSRHEAQVKEMAEQLKLMIKEDEAHAAKPPKEWDKMTKDERVEELIYRLRDQDGAQCCQPGECDIFQDWGGGGNKDTPAHKLVVGGFDAVPALIKILDDRHLTRSVGYHRNFYFSHYVLRYGDCAVRIIERIAGQSFYHGRTTSSYMTKDDAVDATRKAIEAWWADVQRKGPEAVLAEAIRKADHNAVNAASKLMETNAGVALKEIVAATPRPSPRRRRPQAHRQTEAAGPQAADRVP